MQTCENCESKIGALEKPMQWDGHTVCSTCHGKLSAGASVKAPPAAGEIECPYCHKNVVPKKQPKGDMFTAILLLVLGIVPGVVYLAKYSGYMTACPACKVKLADAPD